MIILSKTAALPFEKRQVEKAEIQWMVSERMAKIPDFTE